MSNLSYLHGEEQWLQHASTVLLRRVMPSLASYRWITGFLIQVGILYLPLLLLLLKLMSFENASLVRSDILILILVLHSCTQKRPINRRLDDSIVQLQCH